MNVTSSVKHFEWLIWQEKCYINAVYWPFTNLFKPGMKRKVDTCKFRCECTWEAFRTPSRFTHSKHTIYNIYIWNTYSAALMMTVVVAHLRNRCKRLVKTCKFLSYQHLTSSSKLRVSNTGTLHMRGYEGVGGGDGWTFQGQANNNLCGTLSASLGAAMEMEAIISLQVM